MWREGDSGVGGGADAFGGFPHFFCFLGGGGGLVSGVVIVGGGGFFWGGFSHYFFFFWGGVGLGLFGGGCVVSCCWLGGFAFLLKPQQLLWCFFRFSCFCGWCGIGPSFLWGGGFGVCGGFPPPPLGCVKGSFEVGGGGFLVLGGRLKILGGGARGGFLRLFGGWLRGCFVFPGSQKRVWGRRA